MNESPEQQQDEAGETPHDDDLDIEGPNESGQGRHPTEDDVGEQDG